MDLPPPYKRSRKLLLLTVVGALLVGFLMHYCVNQQRKRYREYDRERAKQQTLIEQSERFKSAEKVYMKRGREVYATCAACHGSQGEGSSSAPPLNDSAWLSPEVLIAVSTYGIRGPIRVHDAEYNMVMPAMGAHLGYFDLAALATYVPTLSGQEPAIVSQEHVKAIVDQLKARQLDSPLTGEMVKSFPELDHPRLNPETLVDKRTGVPES